MKVLITDHEQPDIALESALFRIAGVDVHEAQCRTLADVIEAGAGAAAFIAGTAPIAEAVFDALPGLRMISTPSIGVDHIDLDAARKHGVWVANVPEANINEVATHTLAMALALVRHLPFYDRSVRTGQWRYDAPGKLARPRSLTLGIVGLGRIGRAFATLAAPCFARIVAHDPYVDRSQWPQDIGHATMEEVLAASDIVSLHMPLTPENHNLVDRDWLAAMRSGSYLVNVSRGALVDVAALLEALDSGHLAGAAIDVMPVEPPPADHPLLAHSRVIMSPHAAFYSVEAEEELRRMSVLNVLGWMKDGRPPNVIVEGRLGSL